MLSLLENLGCHAPFEAILHGEIAMFEFQIKRASFAGYLNFSESCLVCAIVSINNKGGVQNVVKGFLHLRKSVQELSSMLNSDEVEFQGIAIINPKVETFLHNLGFKRKITDIPDELGNGAPVEILYKREKI